MSLTNKVLYNIDQRNDTTPEQKETARKNIGAYEDKATAGGIPKADLASEVQSSLGKSDSSVQSVTSNGQTLTKSAAGAIDIPKATDTKWGVVQVVNELKDDQNVIPNSRVIKEAVDPHFMYPTVNESTTFEEVKALVNAGYRPIFVPDINSFGVHTRYILTGARAKGNTPAFIFTALVPGSKYTRYFTSERMQTVICQHANDETEETWVWNDEVLIPNIPEPNQNESDVGKVLTVGEYGELYWDEPAGGNNVEVKAGTDNLHVTSAVVNDKTVFTVSADYYREGQYIHIDENKVITAYGLQPKLATPNSECFLCGKENGEICWFKRKKYMYISDLTSHTLTETDVQNKYCDLPINWDMPSDARICNFMFCMGMSDMYMERGSSTLPLDSRVKKIKCSIFNDGENTWYSNDNAHPSDPNGMIFNDILGSELSRVAGCRSLNTQVKRAGMSGSYLLHLSGPSFRVVFNSDADIQVGDIVVMAGRISGIDFRNGGWGEEI